jgi:hydrogenase maturation protease
VHLAYELLDGWDTLILVDAMTHDEVPGTVSVFEQTWEEGSDDRQATSVADAHDLSPDGVLCLLDGLGGRVDRILTVGCEPADLCEGIGLSEPVSKAVEPAADAVCRLVERLLESQENPGCSRISLRPHYSSEPPTSS